MKPLLVLTLSEEHERTLRVIRLWNNECLLLSSSFPAPVDSVKALFPKRKEALEQAGKLIAGLSGNSWPATEQELVTLLCEEPSDLLTWRRRLHVLLAMAGNMVFAVDDKVGSSQDLITMLTVARIVKAKTLGVIPLGVIPAAIPVTVLAAADAVVSGEADATLASAVLGSLIKED